MTANLDNVLVVGIDFGTTFSGVAWATGHDFNHDNINPILTWPGEGQEKGKTPTELYYAEDGEVYWGYEVPRDVESVKWFKLLLLRDEDLAADVRESEYVRRGRQLLATTSRTATDLVADYLRLLWRHALETIERDRGTAAVEALRLHVVLTVPAIWDNQAREGMATAAGRAGITAERAAGPTMLRFVTEPEAAALATLYNNPNPFRVDDVFVVCDAGGGTIDLISYAVTQTTPVLMEEAAAGSGSMDGSIFVDEAFERMAQRRLGPRWANLSHEGIAELVRGEWQQAIKPQYYRRPGLRRRYNVSIPAEAFDSPADRSFSDTTAEPHIRMGRLQLTADVIESLFADTLAGIDRLIDGQIAEVRATRRLAVTDIILVGGLGSSPYLYQHLKERHDGAGIRILQSTGNKPWTAICRGAVYRGLFEELSDGADADGADAVAADIVDHVGDDASVTSVTSVASVASGRTTTTVNTARTARTTASTESRLRIGPPVQIISTVARFAVGFCFSQAFRDGYHNLTDRYHDSKEDKYFARNQMEWYLHKGESVRALEPVRHEFYIVVDPAKTEWTREIFRCNDDPPPTRKGPSVTKLDDIHCDFSSIADRLPDFVSPVDGKLYKKFTYEIVMRPSGASVTFEVHHNGQRITGLTGVHVL